MCQISGYTLYLDWILSGGLVYIVYVQSTRRPLGRLKRHNVTILSAYPTHIWTEWCGVWCWMSGRWHKDKHVELSRLEEFQTPTVFDHDFNFHCNTFHSSPKIMKIIIDILYIHKNVSAVLIWAILICGFGCMIILFQRCRISFFIKIPCQFRLFTYLHYKQLSHRK